MVEALVPALADTANEGREQQITKKKSYHHGDLRNAIILEATARARESGEKAIVLREIAPQIGVSATAAYRHFTNRQQLVEEVSAQGYLAMAERLAAVEPTTGVSDPVLAAYLDLRNLAMAIVAFAVDEPGWARMMLESLGSSTTVAEKAMEARENLQAVVDRGVEAGAFVQGSNLVGQRSMWAAIDGLSVQAMFGIHQMDTEEASATVARTIDLCLTDLLTDEGLRVRDAADLPVRALSDFRA